jgi:gliding motility-associated-like protein
VVVGSNSVAINLPAGVYNATVAASCGSSAVTVTVGVAPPTTYTVIQPFCGNEAYLYASGTNIQWYNGLAPISASLGGTSPGYTVTNPTNGQQIWLSYLSNQGCRDSVLFLLGQTPAGFVYADNTSLACQNQSNATATIVISPSPGAPVGLSSYSVFSSAGFPNSIYTASLFPTSSNVFIPTGLAAGGYSIIAFDGACKYTNSFTVTEYVYDYSVTPTSSTLCANSSVLAGISFNAPINFGEYSFLWAPYQYMQPSNTDIAVVLSPTTALGTISTFVYSVTVVPAIAYCPITKTISVTAVNLQTPTLSTIPEFCNNSLTKTVTVSQSGGTFSSGGGSVNWLNPVSGVIDPSLTPIGTNTFVYSISVATCVVSNVGSFNVSRFNTAALSGTVPNLCVTNPCVNLMGIVQNTLGSWSGANVNTNIFCPTGLPTNTYVLTYDNPSNPNPFLCPDTQTLAVAVSQTVAPIISPVLPFCTNVPPINMTVTPSGGSWSWGGPNPPIGGPGINSTGLLNPANFPLGFTTLIYTVPTGACINTATTSISATLFRTAALTGSIANLCSNSPPINLMAIVQNTVSGVWSGSGVNSITGIFTPSMSVNMQNYGSFNYTLIYNTYSSPNPNVCPDSRTIVVNILNPAPPIIAPVGPICNADAPFQLAVTPNTGFFTITPYLTSGGLFTPSLCPVGNNLVEYTIGTNTCNVKDSKQISVEGFVPATITGSVSDQCNTNTAVNIANITLNSTGTWSGPGIVGTVFNPQNSGTGSIIITYNTSSVPSGLCPASENLAVNVYSLATPQVVPEGPFCNSGSAVKLRVSPLGGYFEGQNTPAIAPTGLFSPAAAVIGNNIIKYTVTSGPCIAYTEMIIKIEKFISADFLAHKLNYCKMENPLDLNSIAQNPGGLWTGPGVEGSIFTPYKANMGNNNIIIYQTHSLPTASLCPDTSATRLLVNDLLNVPIAANVKTGCAPVEVVFTSSSSEVDRGYWTLGDGSEAVDGLTSVHTYTASGTYSVVFNHWDAIGCAGQSILSTPITVYEQPVAAFSYGDGNNEVTISDPRVQFNNLSTVLSKNTYQWQIGNLYQLTDVNPLVVFPKIGKYEITLTATSVNSCVANTKQTIEVKNDFGVYIPNSFTPNADNLNDEFKPVFTPYGLDAKTFEMEIFDRWGTSLYSTKDVNKGWDGSVQNKGDNVLKQEVYVYKIKYKDLEGTIYNKLGYVTLAR